uniref:GM10787p n=1 Tax=Drosophila melanogaster TaxID=7227 RepID=Q8T945_DROME|nr:GM10787p [Drosophila melanogaster]
MCNSSSNSSCNYSSSNTGRNCRNSKRYCHLPCQQLSFHQVKICRPSPQNEYENKPIKHKHMFLRVLCFCTKLDPSLACSAAADTDFSISASKIS